MPVTTTTHRVQYDTNGTTGPWDVPFYFLSSDDIRVVYTTAAGVPTDLVLTTDYSVTGAGSEDGGSVTTVAAYAAGGTITIVRDVDALQPARFLDTDPFPAATINRALDRLTMIAQQLDEAQARALTLSVSDEISGALDGAVARAGRMLGFDSSTGAPEMTAFTQEQVAAVIAASSVSGISGGHIAGVEVQTVVAGETTITLTSNTYVPGTSSVFLFADGGFLTPGVDFSETDESTVELTSAFAEDTEVAMIVGRMVTSGFEAAAVSIASPGTGGQGVSLQAEIARGWVSVHRFAGVTGDGVTDDTAGIQAAIDFAQENDLELVFDGSKSYYVTDTLNWQHGRTALDTITYKVKVRGNGCTMLPDVNAPLFYIEPRCVSADVGTGREVAEINFGGFFVNGFYVDANSYTSARVMSIGKDGYIVDSFPKSLVYGITTQVYLQPPFLITQARMIKFERLITRDDSGGVKLQILEDGFVGDITFEDCEFEGTETNRPIYVYAAAAGDFAEARGIRFDNCVCYGSGALFESGAHGKVDDIWLANCAWDGPDAPAGENPIEVYAHDGGTVSQWFLLHPYIVNYTGSAVIARCTGASTMRACEISGGYIRQITADDVIDLNNVDNFTVRGVHFIDNTGDNEVRIRDGANHVSVRDCDSDSSCTYFCLIEGASTDNVLVRGNAYTNGSGISNTSSAVTYSITDNLAMTA